MGAFQTGNAADPGNSACTNENGVCVRQTPGGKYYRLLGLV
jgi:hypothetical protein